MFFKVFLVISSNIEGDSMVSFLVNWGKVFVLRCPVYKNVSFTREFVDEGF